MEMSYIIKFLVLTFFVSGMIIFFLHRALISGTEGAVKRLNEEIARANEKQLELGRKLKDADEELEKRRAEAKALEEKMKGDAQEASKAEREKIIAKAREEGEEIIEKAKLAEEKLRHQLEREMDVKILGYSMTIINNIMSDKAKRALNDVLVEEFIENLKDVDMTQISPEVKSVEIVTLKPLEETQKKEFEGVINNKLGRPLSFSSSVDPNIGGGVIVRFGSLALDGSIGNIIREHGIALKAQIESRKA